MKLDIDALAASAAELAGLKPSQAPGLAVLFRMVQREAFCDGARAGRGNYGQDPDEQYREYVTPRPVVQRASVVDGGRIEPSETAVPSEP